MMKHFFFILIFFTVLVSTNTAQNSLSGHKKIDVPFEFVNNFIIVNIQFNNLLNFKFIFDTGAEYTILTKREYADMLGVQYDREFKIVGADLSTTLVAYLARRVNLKLGPIENPNQDWLVMGEDYFRFESLVGTEVHGILGANFFSRYVVKINYKRKVITLYDPQFFKPPSNYAEIPISVHKNKPYVQLDSKLLQNDTMTSLKYLIDTGASLSLLLYTDTHEALKLPEKIVRGNIGYGLGGYIEGFTGRFHELNLGPHKLNDVVGNYQEVYEFMDSTEIKRRNGLIGNMVLKRFELIIDYFRGKLYLKPNRSFKKAFKYDRSGITLIASGKELNTFTVNYVVPDSPADLAGILVGDEVKKVNWMPAKFFSLPELSNKLKGKIGKDIKLTIIRDNQKFKKRFKLKEII